MAGIGPFSPTTDMLNWGMRPTPVGVSDSHSHRGGVGEKLTWLPIDIGNIRELTNDHIRKAVREGGTVVSHGPLVVATIDDVWAPGTNHVGAVDVNVDIRTPSWMDVTTLRVYEKWDGNHDTGCIVQPCTGVAPTRR